MKILGYISKKKNKSNTLTIQPMVLDMDPISGTAMIVSRQKSYLARILAHTRQRQPKIHSTHKRHNYNKYCHQKNSAAANLQTDQLHDCMRPPSTNRTHSTMVHICPNHFRFYSQLNPNSLWFLQGTSLLTLGQPTHQTKLLRNLLHKHVSTKCIFIHFVSLGFNAIHRNVPVPRNRMHSAEWNLELSVFPFRMTS